MFTEIFGLLKLNKFTGSDKDKEVQLRTAEVNSENLSNTKLCHSSSTRVPASLWNPGRKKKVAVHSKRPWESQSPLCYNRISSRNPKHPRTKRTRENAEKLKVMLNDKQQFSVRNIAPLLTLSPTTLWRILRYDTKAKFYRPSTVQPLTEDHKVKEESSATGFCSNLMTSCNKWFGPMKRSSSSTRDRTVRMMVHGAVKTLIRCLKSATEMVKRWWSLWQ